MEAFTFTLMALTAIAGVGAAAVVLLMFIGSMTLRQLERLEHFVGLLAIFAAAVAIATVASPAM